VERRLYVELISRCVVNIPAESFNVSLVELLFARLKDKV
jgi:hypothetical protein